MNCPSRTRRQQRRDNLAGIGVHSWLDTQRLAGGATETTEKVWDLETGVLLTTFTCHAAARCCAISGARRVVAGDAAGRVYFLSLEFKDDK